MSGPATTAGVAGYARLVFEGRDVQPTFEALLARASATPADAGAMLDLSTLLQLVGEREQGLALQADALARQRHYRKRLGTGVGPRLLALVAAGDLMASTPVEFLLAGWNGELDLIFLTPGDRLDGITEHDIAILAVGESDANAPILDWLGEIVPRWPRSMLNGAPEAIRALGRDRAPERLAGAPGLVAPPTRRLGRAELARRSPATSRSSCARSTRTPAAGWRSWRAPPTSPAISRSNRASASTCSRSSTTAGRTAASASCASRWWTDARSSSTWRSPTTGWSTTSTPAWPTTPPSAPRKPRLMATFETGFAARHAEAFTALHAAFGLDYFAIDCAEDRDGPAAGLRGRHRHDRPRHGSARPLPLQAPGDGQAVRRLPGAHRIAAGLIDLLEIPPRPAAREAARRRGRPAPGAAGRRAG